MIQGDVGGSHRGSKPKTSSDENSPRNILKIDPNQQ